MRFASAAATSAAVLLLGSSLVAAQLPVTYTVTAPSGNEVVYTAVDVDGEYTSDQPVLTQAPGADGALPTTTTTTPLAAVPTTTTRRVAAATTTTAAVPGGAALGGGGGAAQTTFATLQVISGYTPPASSRLPAPDVAAGTSIAPSAIPGYSEAQAGGDNKASGNIGSGAARLASSGAGASLLALCAAIAAAAALA